MCQWIRSALVQVMACRLFGAKPLTDPLLTYCQLDSWEHISVNSNRNSVIFIQETAFEIVVYHNGGHFVQGDTKGCDIHWVSTISCRVRLATTQLRHQLKKNEKYHLEAQVWVFLRHKNVEHKFLLSRCGAVFLEEFRQKCNLLTSIRRFLQ